MRDLFDDFMEELRKREAVARGQKPDPDAPRRTPSGDDDDKTRPDDESGEGAAESVDDQRPGEGDDERVDGGDDERVDDGTDDDAEREEPTVLHADRDRGGGRGRRGRRSGRTPGGPNDGGRGRTA